MIQSLVQRLSFARALLLARCHVARNRIRTLRIKDAATPGQREERGTRHCARVLGAGRHPAKPGCTGAINCAGIMLTQRVLGQQGMHDLASFTKVVQINLSGRSESFLRVPDCQ